MGSPEVWRIAIRDLWRDHVADGLDLVPKDLSVRDIGTIELRARRQAHVPVIDIVESIGRVGYLHLSGCIPRPGHLIRIHPVGQAELRSNIDIIEQGKAGIDGNAMLESVLPILDQAGMEELVFLCADRIGELSCIAHGDFLIPFLLTHSIFPAERIEPTDGYVQVGQCHGEARVAHVLRQVGSRAEGHPNAGECRAIADRGCTRTLRHRLWVVHAVQVVSLIGSRREVDTGRKGAERIGLGILSMAPLHLEALL